MLVRSSIRNGRKYPRIPVGCEGSGFVFRPPNGRAGRVGHVCGKIAGRMPNALSRHDRVMLDVTRRCLVCDWTESVTEPEETDVLGPPCSRCRAPSERIAVLARRVERIVRNPHAAALGRLGGQRGGLARAAALSPRRRRDIARAAALARWRK